MANPDEVYRAAQAMLSVLELARVADGTPNWVILLIEAATKQAKDAGITEQGAST